MQRAARGSNDDGTVCGLFVDPSCQTGAREDVQELSFRNGDVNGQCCRCSL